MHLFEFRKMMDDLLRIEMSRINIKGKKWVITLTMTRNIEKHLLMRVHFIIHKTQFKWIPSIRIKLLTMERWVIVLSDHVREDKESTDCK